MRASMGITLFLMTLPSWGYHVFLDPGHGGIDRGATAGLYQESQIVLKVSQILKRLLDRDPDFSSSLSRHRDHLVSLQRRADLAHQKNVDLFVSIHVNASTDFRVRGGEIYFKNQLPPDEEALIYASHELIDSEGKAKIPPMKISRQKQLKPEVADIIRDLKRNNNLFSSGELSKSIAKAWRVPKSRIRHIRQAPFFVVSKVHIPSVLVELGFITHKGEAQLLNQRDYQIKLAQSIYEGLKEYKKAQHPSRPRITRNLQSP